MKTATSNQSGEALEIAKRIIFTMQVLIIGLFIPFSFVFGITYNRHDSVAVKSSNAAKTNQVNTANTIDLGKILSDQNS